MTYATCARCGDCCERVAPNQSIPDLRRRLADPYFAGRARHQAELLLDMLVEKIGVTRAPLQIRPEYRCRHFDPAGRVCTAHEKRPDMCRGYPWYRKSELEGFLERDRLPRDMSPRCSYTADVRRMLPIVETR